MASKNAPADLLAEGFAAEQFGPPAATWADYAQALLDKVTETVQERVGATNYALTSGPVFEHVKAAELSLACAILVRRRINRIDTTASAAHEDVAVAALLRELRANRLQYEADAEREFAAIPAATSTSESTSSGPAFGAALSSHFE